MAAAVRNILDTFACICLQGKCVIRSFLLGEFPHYNRLLGINVNNLRSCPAERIGVFLAMRTPKIDSYRKQSPGWSSSRTQAVFHGVGIESFICSSD
jgi:hypothetical protein